MPRRSGSRLAIGNSSPPTHAPGELDDPTSIPKLGFGGTREPIRWERARGWKILGAGGGPALPRRSARRNPPIIVGGSFVP